MTYVRLSHPSGRLFGNVKLDGSKSISNRALIISALAETPIEITGLSVSDDTAVLQQMLGTQNVEYNAGDAGTAFRFMLAFLCLNERQGILTGSQAMQKRPIGDLVDSLILLGADIRYLAHEGYPPVEIRPKRLQGGFVVPVRAGISSQFVTALMLIAPCLEGGLTLRLEGPVLSFPYIEMTAKLMRHFEVDVQMNLPYITIPGNGYVHKPLTVEPDYSGASYYFGYAANANGAEIELEGFSNSSIQGDAIIAEWMQAFDVETSFSTSGLLIRKRGSLKPYKPVWDFTHHPDLFQTMAATCACAEIEAEFTGLHNLRWKETDRIRAMSDELGKVGLDLLPIPDMSAALQLRGKADWYMSPEFDSHGDHRMAMALSILSLASPLVLDDAQVVTKSYPAFWSDLTKVGFLVE